MSPQSTTRMTNAPSVFGAAEDGDAALLKRLLESGAPADARSAPGGETPLMRAAARGHVDVVRVLLDAGADPCARRADSFTPLILAVFFGHEGVVRLLVERGADAHARTGLGTTAARWAEARGFASMAEVLRAAEAARPPAPAGTQAVEHVPEKRPAAASAFTSEEVEIFFKGRGPIGAPGEGEADEAQARSTEPDEQRAGLYDEEGDSSHATAAGASVRREGRLPAHPSATVFRLGDFLRSWPGGLGALLLLAAFGVAVFALAQRGSGPRGNAQPAPPSNAQQAVAQQAPAPLTPTPTPVFPTPDPLGVIPVTDQGYPAPNANGQPFYVTTSPVTSIPSDVPRELTVVSENGGSPAQDGGQNGRRAGANASPTPAPRNDNANDSAPRAARTPDPEQTRPETPAAPANQPPTPAPQPTPGRAKVIQWPPQ